MSDQPLQTASNRYKLTLDPATGVASLVLGAAGGACVAKFAAERIEARKDTKASRALEDKNQFLRAEQRLAGNADSVTVMSVPRDKLYDVGDNEVFIFGSNTRVKSTTYQALVDMNDNARQALNHDNISSESLNGGLLWGGGVTPFLAVGAYVALRKVKSLFSKNKKRIVSADRSGDDETPTVIIGKNYGI